MSSRQICAHVLVCLGAGVGSLPASADVFHMAAGQTSLQFVTVGNPGNLPDTRTSNHYGTVAYSYQLGQFEITAGQYAEFLNAVGSLDPYGLYDTAMDYDANPSSLGCNIKRTGISGAYHYSVPQDWSNRPVNWISWSSAIRFCNWLTNGQPTGLPGPSTTEDGSYPVNGLTGYSALRLVRRSANARYVIPGLNEWYKGAYYDPAKPGGPGYWTYPTRSDSAPSHLLDPAGTNNANYASPGFLPGAPYWRTEVGFFSNSPGPYGTFDQGGNVEEMIDAIIPGSFFRASRGGSYALDASYMTPSATDANSGISIPGFRIALVPEPATWGLLGVVMLGRRPSRWRVQVQS